ncbi:Inner membrane protein YjgN [Klebsiella quasivariicola]|uniref:YjgN family protein n=1 Tax=Klebsiella TaxID=570 RepID=UPI0010D7C5A6|nr:MULTISPECIES: DUF898 family protein [Klebsiella]MBS5209700.1 DUF898 family protein [Klebsiella sp.]MDF2009014.1 DUF898 family protein [Klebsiella quasivariicola]MDK7209604.1 DUF898 family protein [Klebsiella quasivariicola]VGQ04389.1 Inner membrane protein YjgN [Klebsiella quasivariicola]
MSMISGQSQSSGHPFVFHGQAGRYFVICLVNVILSVITLGIFIPWAWVRNHRYLCENMEVNGVRFAYHGRGITIFLSWLLIFIVLLIVSLALAIFAPGCEGLETLVFVILLPVMFIRGLNYHANMTSFATIRFGVQCNLLRGWWIMLGLPLLIYVITAVVFSVLGSRLWFGYGINGMLVGLVILFLLTLCIMAVTSGVVYSHWYDLIGKGATLGKNKFNIYVSTKRCVVIFLLATAILLPFIIIFVGFLFSAVAQLLTGCMFGLCREGSALFMALRHLGAILGGYLFLTIGIVLSIAYLRVALRNHVINNLVLGDHVHFRSTLTFCGLAPRILALTFLSLLTLGLTYPWFKIVLLRYLAENTTMVGELDSLDLQPAAPPQPTRSDKLCGGFFPTLPFLD